MASSSAQQTTARGFRLRDLMIALVIMLIGSTMVYTVLTNGDGQYNNLAIYAFAVGGSMLVIALLGGVMIDKITVRHPSLGKPHGSPLVFSVLALAGSFGLIVAWMQLSAWFGTVNLAQYLPW
jgi:hypothetical protein